MYRCTCQEPGLLAYHQLTDTHTSSIYTCAHYCYCYLNLPHLLMLTQVLSLMQLLGWSCDMHVTEDGQSNDLQALDVVLK